MILNSTINMQITSVLDSERGSKYFHAFADSDNGIPIMNTTLIIECMQGKCIILRVIKDEIVSLLVIGKSLLTAISKFGNVYQFDGVEWNDIYKSQPTRFIFKSIVQDDIVHSVCAGGNFLQYDKGWKIIANDIGNNNLKLIGVCNKKNNSFLVCGGNGILASVSKSSEVQIIDIPTNAYLLDVKNTQDNNFAVCGRQSTLFVGNGDYWNDFSKPDKKVNFTSMAFWKDRIYLSAKNQVLFFDGGEYTTHGSIRSLNLFALKNELWSIGLKCLYRFDGSNWDEVIVEVDTDQYKERLFPKSGG